MTDLIPERHLLASSDTFQLFPFYTYDEDGTNRRENITDWALAEYRSRYGADVTKWEIFHAVYGLLHSPDYRERYAENLKRELPRIPCSRPPASAPSPRPDGASPSCTPASRAPPSTRCATSSGRRSPGAWNG
jgi:predicted helicase